MPAIDTLTASKRDHAKYWAARGYRVHPCEPNGKRPLTKWQETATKDPAKIDTLWSEFPSANVGLLPDSGGAFVVDLDVTKGRDGPSEWARLQAEHGLAEPFLTVETPSGGRHLYFKGSMPSSASKLASGIDVRGVGGYVLSPGSTNSGGDYRIVAEQAVLQVPAWLNALGSSPALSRSRPDIPPDLPHNVERARKRLEDAPPAIEGIGGNAHTLQVANEVLDLVSPDVCLELMRDWNECCIPEWPDDELAAIIENAAKYRENDIGCDATPDPNVTYAKLAQAETARPPLIEAPKSKFRLLRTAALLTLPDITWLVSGFIPNHSTAMLYAAPGQYKSFIALHFCFQLALTGKPVVIFAGEGVLGLKRRVIALCHPHGVAAEDVPLFVIPAVPHPSEIGEAVAFLRSNDISPALVVIDTMHRMSAGLDENSSKDAGLILNAVDTLKEALQCAVLVVHHSGKDANRGARGSSAFDGGFDVRWEVTANPDTLTAKLTCEKMKDDELPKPMFFKGRRVLDSLVFERESAADYQAAVQRNDDAAVSFRKVAAALRELGGQVKTTPLAMQLLGAADTSAPGMKNVCNVLTREARGELKALSVNVGTNAKPKWEWRLPDLTGLEVSRHD